jgi:hypothetical protein
MRLKLTPGQSCYLHGWLNPKPHLSWPDIRNNPALTLQNLLSAGLDLDDLHHLQPEVSEWVKAGRVTIGDCPLMADLWGAHPVKDFKADLGDVAGFKWSADTMLKAGLTYAELVDLGLTPASMVVFTHITLYGWAQLGMTRADVARFPEPVVVSLFGLPKQEVLRSLK